MKQNTIKMNIIPKKTSQQRAIQQRTTQQRKTQQRATQQREIQQTTPPEKKINNNNLLPNKVDNISSLKLKTKINKYKKNMDIIKSSDIKKTTLLLNSLDKKWKCKWKNHVDNKIILKRELIVSSNVKEYDYTLNINKLSNINKVFIKKCIIPKQHITNDLYLHILLTNLNINSTLLFSKEIKLNNTYCIYENIKNINEIEKLNKQESINKLSIKFENFTSNTLNNHFNINSIIVTTIKILNNTTNTINTLLLALPDIFPPLALISVSSALSLNPVKRIFLPNNG